MNDIVTNETTQRMDPELKAKWVAALRSGKYPQGRTFLHSQNGSYCCLGVLRELANPHDSRSVAGVLLSKGQRNAYGLSVSAHHRLTAMNDTDKKTFPEIADWIEENL